ncbi:helix-turn-helix domain-containing protein [Amycolatopsis sp. CA-161197]|uniref:helix-turn-helix domain-containing protein n=1 Tax=Amycolatopsis sp. CA-161197 TaxID=3239922 RepID=UPI003D8CFBC2
MRTLRMLRRERGWTLDELARRTGLTKSYLSKVERGNSTPSIAVAIGLAEALGVDVTQLFGDAQDSANLEVRRAGAAADPTVPDSGSSFVHLAGGVVGKQMLPFLIYPPTDEVECLYRAHSGDELILVRSGEIEMRFPDRTERLAAGDSVYFRGGIPHYVKSISAEPAEVLVVIAAPEEQP